MKPELKQFGNLTELDFKHFPVWVGVHTLDYDEPWYDETDEETFRPWCGELPVDPSQGMFLVRSQMTFKDGSVFVGFITPATGNGKATDNDLGAIQPNIFTRKKALVAFWGGMFGSSKEKRNMTYELFERNHNQIFPILFRAESGLTKGKQFGEISGFYETQIKNGKMKVAPSEPAKGIDRFLFFLRKSILKGLLFFFAPSILFFINKSLALLYKSFQSNSLDVWAKISDTEIDFYMYPGTWLMLMTAYFAYHSWSKSADQFLLWIRNGRTYKVTDWWFSEKSKPYHLWANRILSILGLLAGLFLIWIALNSIWLKYSGVGP